VDVDVPADEAVDEVDGSVGASVEDVVAFGGATVVVGAHSDDRK